MKCQLECALGIFNCADPAEFTSCPQLCGLCPFGGTTISTAAPLTTTTVATTSKCLPEIITVNSSVNSHA